jgi:hypothetical protein
MLRTYVLHPELLEPGKLSGASVADFASLIEALLSHVSLIVPRPDLQAFWKLTRHADLGAKAEANRERLLVQLANSGPALRILEWDGGTAMQRCLKAACSEKVDAALTISRKEPLPGGLATMTLAQLAQETASQAEPVDLGKVGGFTEVEALLARFFRRDDYLSVIDPYIGRHALHGFDGPRGKPMRIGLEMILRVWASQRAKVHPEPTVEFVVDPKKIRQDPAERRPKGAGDEELVEVARKLSALVDAICSSQIGSPRIKVELRTSIERFAHRGMRSSRRDWVIDHNIDEFGKWLAGMKNSCTRPPRQQVPSIRILHGTDREKSELIRLNSVVHRPPF